MSNIPTFPPQKSRLPMIFGAIILSMASGAIGTLLLFWFFPEFRQAKIPAGSQAIIVQQPGKVVIEEGIRLKDVAEKTRPLIAEIYHPTQAIKFGTHTVYPPGRRLGYAVMLTSNGWFGTVAALKLAPKDILVLSGQAYQIDRLIADPASPLVVGKLNNGTFPVTSYVSGLESAIGTTIVAVTRDSAFRTTLWNTANSLDPKTASLSSDRLSESIRLADQVAFLPGTPFFDLSGSLLGLVDTSHDGVTSAIPATALESLLNHALTSLKPSRPYLGLNYLKITNYGQGEETAYFVFHENSALAVLPKSPAAVAKLKAGDQITEVNGTGLSQDKRSLFEIIQQYKPGEIIELKYMRGGIINEVRIRLGDLSSQ